MTIRNSKNTFPINKRTCIVFSTLILLVSTIVFLYFAYDRKNDEILSAVEGDRLDDVKKLIKAKADPNYYELNLLNSNPIAQYFHKTNGNFTLLMIAVNRNNLAVAKALIEAGADVNAKYYNGSIWTSPLLYAANNEKTDLGIVRMLLDHGADVNFNDGNHRSILNYALSFDV